MCWCFEWVTYSIQKSNSVQFQLWVEAIWPQPIFILSNRRYLKTDHSGCNGGSLIFPNDFCVRCSVYLIFLSKNLTVYNCSCMKLQNQVLPDLVMLYSKFLYIRLDCYHKLAIYLISWEPMPRPFCVPISLASSWLVIPILESHNVMPNYFHLIWIQWFVVMYRTFFRYDELFAMYAYCFYRTPDFNTPL